MGQYDQQPQKTETDAVAKAVRDHQKPRVLRLEDPTRPDAPLVPVLVAPSGLEVTSVKDLLEEYLPAPARRTGVAKMLELASLIDHANRFKDSNSALFASAADPKQPTMQVVFDYNQAGPDNAKARFGQHRATYSFPVSTEWAAWRDKNGQQFSQAQFAEFVENRIVDVIDPSGAGKGAKEVASAIGCEFASPSKLLELSRGLSVRVDARVQSQNVLATGETQFTFVSEHKDQHGAALKIPGAFLIGIAVFGGGAAYQIPVRLRYRVREGVISWFYELYRAERSFEHAFKEACEKAQKDTGLPLFFGSPEAG